MEFTWLRQPVQRKKRAAVPVAATVVVLISASALGGALSPVREKVHDLLQAVDSGAIAADGGRGIPSRTQAENPSPASSAGIPNTDRPWSTFTERAHSALAQALVLEQQGSAEHVALAEEQALTWAEAARDLKRTISIEQRAMRLEQDLLSARRTLKNAETLLEETSIRRARAEAQLRRADQSFTRSELRSPKSAETR